MNTTTQKPYQIPEISDARLFALVEKIKPVVCCVDGELCYIEPCDPRKVAFLWSPRRTWKASGLEAIGTIQTLHRYGYHGWFKPSLAEVFAQLPEELAARAVAFECIGPKTAEDLIAQRDAVNAGFHVATVILYARRK